jgi:hypothetical protein
MMRRVLTYSFFALLPLILLGLAIPSQPTLAQEGSMDGLNIYFSEANSEASRFDRFDRGISRYAGLLAREGANLFTLEWRKGIPDDADLIVIIAPESDLDSNQVARLWAYIRGGGRVLLVTEPIGSRDTISRSLAETRGFFELSWSELALRARDDILVEQGEFSVIDVVETDRDGNVLNEYTANVPVLNTEFLTTDFDSRHPITAGIAGEVYYDTARSVEYDATISDFIVTPFLFDGTADSYGETDYSTYLELGTSEINIDVDTGQARVALGAAYDDPNSGARFVLLGDGDIVFNGSGFETSPPFSPNFIYPTNAQLMINITSWLLATEPVTLSFPEAQPTSTPTSTITPTPMPTEEASDNADTSTGS